MQGFAQPFAALVLAEVARRSHRPYLSVSERAELAPAEWEAWFGTLAVNPADNGGPGQAQLVLVRADPVFAQNWVIRRFGQMQGPVSLSRIFNSRAT